MPSGTFLAAGGSQWIPQRPEFLAIARQLREGWNPYLGAAPLAAIRNEIRSTAAQRPLKERLELQLALAFKLLEQGDPDGALEAISHAFALAEAIPGALDQHAYLYRARALDQSAPRRAGQLHRPPQQGLLHLPPGRRRRAPGAGARGAGAAGL